MERHPREIITSNAMKEFWTLYIDWRHKHDLTRAERMSILVNALDVDISYIVRDEREDEDEHEDEEDE